jgi:5'-3' exonuclease
MEFILIDGSYFIYHRYYSLKNWWNNAKSINESDIPFENERFVEKYKSTFVSKVKEVKEKYSTTQNPIILAGRDCNSRDIWRRKLFAEYKHGRKKDDIGIKDSFSIAYTDELFEKAGVQAILYDENLEADDCIAITVKHIVSKYPDAKIIIITSDMDYLQLAQENVRIFNLNFKELIESKQSYKNAKKDLFCKIVAGDKSDNISSVFSRCGIKTAAKYYENKSSFEKKLELDENARQIFAFNQTLIDFEKIPKDLVERFKSKCLKL